MRCSSRRAGKQGFPARHTAMNGVLRPSWTAQSINPTDMGTPPTVRSMYAYREFVGIVGTAIDAVGVIVIASGAIIATTRFALRLQGQPARSYTLYRQNLARAILLGLEFLIAGDIIRTVVLAPTLRNLAALAIIVLIRTFLSMTLQLEVEGRWPWQPAKETLAPEIPPDSSAARPD